MKSTPQSPVSSCPIEFTIDILGNKWCIPILRELFSGRKRTHQLLAALPGLSTKILALRLRELENHGLITRTVYPEVPPHVEYALTDKGYEVQPILTALKVVGLRWLNQVPCRCALDNGVVEQGDPVAS